MKVRVCEKRYSKGVVATDRKLVTSSSAFGILREQLARNIGTERIRGFLFQFGWEMGVNDAKEVMKQDLSLEDLIKYGPILHINNGHILGIQHECDAEVDPHGNLVSILGTGTWIDSYEAAEHIQRLGRSDKPVCHTLTGYASGFMSTITGELLVVKEETCVGKGDAECRWTVQPYKEWGADVQNDFAMYNETPIVQELEYTYEQLLEQKNVITRLAEFQRKITEEIISGSDLKAVAEIANEVLGIAVTVEGIDLQTITFSGISEERYTELKRDIEAHIQRIIKRNRFGPNGLYPVLRRKTLETSLQQRIMTPIFVQKEMVGYCSFVYEPGKNEQQTEDYLFLDRFANAAALVLLNEKAKFDSFERMKGNFLEQILDGQLTVSEIIKRGQYAGIDLRQAYVITVVEFIRKESDFEEEFHLSVQIFEAISQYFSENQQSVLISQHDRNITLYIAIPDVKNLDIYLSVEQLNNYLAKRFQGTTFKFGISNPDEDVKKAPKHFEEATVALRLSTRNEIGQFRFLGILGVLINPDNMDGIKMIARQELGSLYNLADPKSMELIKTLYVFLVNGGKLEQTMSELSLSISGLRHRIRRIESVLRKDLRDPNEMHQLLLILKSLIALGELTLE